MAWTKAKTAAVAVVGLLLAAGTATVAVKEVVAHRGDDAWRIENIGSDRVAKAPPLVRILPTKFSGSHNSSLVADRPGEGANFIGIRVAVEAIAEVAYQWFSPARIIFATAPPETRYDFISTLPHNSAEALQGEMKKELGLVGHREEREVDVLLLKVKNPNAPGIKPPGPGNVFFMNQNGNNARIRWDNQPLPRLCEFLERLFHQPVVDETGATGQCSLDLRWTERGGQNPNDEALKEALLKQLGLELVPGRRSIEMLVIEKTK